MLIFKASQRRLHLEILHLKTSIPTCLQISLSPLPATPLFAKREISARKKRVIILVWQKYTQRIQIKTKSSSFIPNKKHDFRIPKRPSLQNVRLQLFGKQRKESERIFYDFPFSPLQNNPGSYVGQSTENFLKYLTQACQNQNVFCRWELTPKSSKR